MAGDVKGLREAVRTFKRLPEAARLALLEPTEATARALVDRARRQLEASPSIQTRGLYDAVAYSINRKTGKARVGIARGRGRASRGANAPAQRAHYVEYGTIKMDAEPFMRPSAAAERQPYIARCRAVKARLVALLRR